jgi:protein-disulfide isomerase
MMRRHSVQAGVAGMVALLLWGCGQSKGPVAGAEVVASFDGKTISRAELDARVKSDRQASAQMFDVEDQRHTILENALESMINQSLFQAEARRRGMSVDKLMAAEVDAKIAPVTDAEKRAQYEAIKDRVKDQPEAEILRRIEDGMRQDRQAERREAFANELWTKARATILLDAPRLTVDPDKAPAQGPASAPVTIVEYSDFQCPYCSRAAAALRQVRQHYGDRVRLVFRNFPLTQIHPNAQKAAEAASCASEQGRFWEMHDRLFEKQEQLAPADLKRYASDLGLNAAAFARCLDSGKAAKRVQQDVAAAEQLGVRGTPGIFVNGRVFRGALPFERLVRVVDMELARLDKTAPPAAVATPK